MAKKTKYPASEGVKLNEVDVPAAADESHSLRDRAMLVRLQLGCWQGAGKDNAVAEELRVRHGGEGVVGTFRKLYMDRAMLKKVFEAGLGARRFHRVNTLPWGDTGARLLAATNFFAYKKQMTSFEREFNLAVDEYMAGYDRAVLEQKKRLGSMWRASDYPPADKVRDQFKFVVNVEPIPTADDFRLKLSADEANDLKRDYDAEVRRRMKGAVQEVFANVHETVLALHDKLADPDAKVRSSSFGALRKLVASLPQLNEIVQDPNITAIGKRIAEELVSVDVDAVAHDSHERGKVVKKADALLAALKPLQSWGSVKVA